MSKKSEFKHSKSTVVIGDGWSALGSVGILALAGKPVTWVAGTGARLLSPLPVLEAGHESVDGAEKVVNPGSTSWDVLARGFGIEAGPLTSGSFLREFRNKAFREVAWSKAPTPETREEVLNESLWESERVLVPLFECRFSLTPVEIEERVRAKIAEMGKIVRRIEGVPLQEVIMKPGAATSVRLASGEVIETEHVIYADRWNQLASIDGLPKGITFYRKRNPVSVLQAEFEHETALSESLQEGFFGTIHREAGEEMDRHVWGYFTSDGARSIWSLCVSPEEGEDNHMIAKRLRRMKNSLEKMFAGSEYFSKIRSERVRFEESILYTAGDAPNERLPRVAGVEGISFLTDGYGPTAALKQVNTLLSAEFEAVLTALAKESGPDTEAKSSDLADSPLS